MMLPVGIESMKKSTHRKSAGSCLRRDESISTLEFSEVPKNKESVQISSISTCSVNSVAQASIPSLSLPEGECVEKSRAPSDSMSPPQAFLPPSGKDLAMEKNFSGGSNPCRFSPYPVPRVEQSPAKPNLPVQTTNTSSSDGSMTASSSLNPAPPSSMARSLASILKCSPQAFKRANEANKPNPPRAKLPRTLSKTVLQTLETLSKAGFVPPRSLSNEPPALNQECRPQSETLWASPIKTPGPPSCADASAFLTHSRDGDL